MDDKSKNKTARFLDALDDTIPRFLGGKAGSKEASPSKQSEALDAKIQQATRDPRMVRFVHACGLLLVCTAAPSQIDVIAQHLNGTSPMSAMTGLGAAVVLGVDAVFLCCWYQFTRE
jgi:hypothetical protein